jgi:hypothetical protein
MAQERRDVVRGRGGAGQRRMQRRSSRPIRRGLISNGDADAISRHFERSLLQYALETDWLVGHIGLAPALSGGLSQTKVSCGSKTFMSTPESQHI